MSLDIGCRVPSQHIHWLRGRIRVRAQTHFGTAATEVVDAPDVTPRELRDYSNEPCSLMTQRS